MNHRLARSCVAASCAGPRVRRRHRSGAVRPARTTRRRRDSIISGYWTSPLQEDAMERGAGPELGDYGGFPHQRSRPAVRAVVRSLARHAAASSVRRLRRCHTRFARLGNSRAWEERDPHTQRLVAIHWYSQTFEGHRTIWMDGRPHPPAWAPHTWMGFSTGRFVGNALEVQTTHLKQGWLRRNGRRKAIRQRSIEFFVRHGDHLTHTAVVTDPVYLAEPQVRQHRLRPSADRPPDVALRLRRRRADPRSRAGRVPNYAVRQNPFAQGVRDRHKIPVAASSRRAARRCIRTRGPLVAALTDADGAAEDAAAPRGAAPRAAPSIPSRTTATCTSGPSAATCTCSSAMPATSSCRSATKGAFVVDSGTGPAAPTRCSRRFAQLSDKPIQFIANTEFHAGTHRRQRRAARAGRRPERSRLVLLAAVRRCRRRRHDHGAPERAEPDDAREASGRRASRATPTSRNGAARFTTTMRSRCSGQPNAVTDGDSLVHFRRADVIVTGDIFTTTQYPVHRRDRTAAACRARSRR